MSAPGYVPRRRPPPLYRVARALRRASVIVLLLLILFTASVVYSTYELTRSSSNVSAFSAGFASNGTVLISGALTLNNPGFYPIEALSGHLRVLNDSRILLGSFAFGPVTLASEGTTEFPVALYLPVSATSPGASLLVATQYLNVSAWGNATFGYLFPATVSFQETRFWGAPFDHLAVTLGNATVENGTVVVPATVSFQNEAMFADAGALHISVVAANGTVCGTASWTVDVGPGQPFSQTQPVPLPSGCSPRGGQVIARYVTPTSTISLPSEPIP